MKNFYFLFILLLGISSTFAQQHHISEVGIPVDGLVKQPTIVENTVLIGDDQNLQEQQSITIPTGPILFEDVDFNGATKGQFSVLNGAATYNLPIEVPPGINGIEPKIGISYSSQSGNGIAGYGWNISGLSTITKIGSNKYYDDKNSVVNYSSDDRFMLDGQRLLLKSGTYGTQGAQYETENFSNLKITGIGSAQHFNHNYFKVEYPDGSVAYYGQVYTGFGGSITRTNTTYALTYITNKQNVIIKYNYINDNGNLLISSIAYGYRSTNPLNEILLANTANYITFTYKNRNRPETGYIYNETSKITKILDKITVKGYAENYRTYQLTYRTTSLGYEQLQKITETSGDGTISKSPVTFSYGSDPTQNFLSETTSNIGSSNSSLSQITRYNTKTISGDFSGSGKLGYLMYHTTINDGKGLTKGDVLRIFDPGSDTLYSRTFSTPFNEVVATKSLNFNDILLPNQGFTTITKTNTVPYGGYRTFNFDSFIFMPDYFGQMALISSKPFNLRNYQYGNDEIRDYFISGDFNGDGISDIIRTEYPGNYINNSYDPYSTQLEIIDLKNDVVYNNQTLPIGFAYYVVDTDNDGYDEFVVIRHQRILIHKFNQSTNRLELWQTIIAPNISYTNTDKRPVYLGDFNGDGKLDFVTPNANNSNNWTFYINRTTNFKTITKNIGIGFSHSTEQEAYASNGANLGYFNINEYDYLFTDINNDGKTDIVKTHDYCKVRNNTSNDYDNISRLWIYENLNFDAENEIISLSNVLHNFSTDNNRSPVYTISNYNQKNYKTELAVLTNNRLNTLQSQRNNVLTQQLKTINEFDLTTNITYDSYDEKKIDPATDGEDAVLPFVSFNQPMSIYPKADIDVVPGLYLVKKVAYNTEKGILIGGSPDRKQLFTYGDATISHNGKGFLGFKGNMATNIYAGGPTIFDLKDQIKNITIFDLENNGLVKEEYVVHSTDWANFYNTPVNYLTKKINTYNITNLSNKVFKAQNIQTVNNEGLTSVQRIVNSTYDAYSNPLSVTETVTGGGETSTLNTVFTYNHNLVSDNYYIGRLTSKILKMNNEQTSKEEYTYANHLLTNIKKQGGAGSPELSEENQYDAFGNIIQKTISSIGIQPRIASSVYDNTGRFIEKATDIEGLETTYVYNKNKGWLLSQTKPYGLTSTFVYNSFGMVLSETDYLGNTTNFAYKTNAKVLGSSFVRKEIDYPDGRKEKVTTNGWGNKTYEGSTDIDGNWINNSYSYDSQNRLIKQSEPYTSTANLFTNFEYDKFGRIIKTVLPTGKEITATYNGLSYTVSDGVRTKTETKNANNQTKKVVDNGETINHVYNANGTLKNTSYSGTVISFEYDGWGRKTKITDPSAGTYTYQYNSVGDLLLETTPNGTTTHTYDASGKIQNTSFLNTNISYIYNNDKLLDKIITNTDDGNYEEKLVYDTYKRNIGKSYSTPHSLIYIYNNTFDGLGRVSTNSKTVIGFNGQDIVRTKNVYKNGYLWKLQNAVNDTDLKVYNSFNQKGQVTSFTLANGLVTNRSYDQYGYLTQNVVNKNNIQQFAFTNTWDVQRGNLTARTNSLFSNGISESFQYDSFDRLTNSHTSRGSITITEEDISYDGKGRITQAKPGKYNYDAAKQYQLSTVTDINTLGYYQDNPLQQITYNSQKAPLTIKQQGKENIYFKYDGFNNRTAMYYGNEAADYNTSSKVRYYSPLGDIEVDFDKATNKYIVNMYVDGDSYSSNIIQRKENNATAFYYLHRDYLGSILAVTDNAGAIVEKRHFDAWGNVLLVQDGQNNNLSQLTFLERGYTGHEHLQGVGLINMNARLYDAKLHRFLAPDNFIQDPSNSQSFNRYGYVWNNPLRFTDPNGEFVVVAIIVGAVVGAYLGGSAANDNFNPFQWDWSAGSTWNGMLGGAVIGAAAGATVGFGLTAVIGVGYSSTFVSIAGYTAFATSAISSVTTAASLISDFDNGMRIFAGRFYIDENRGFWGGMLQSLSHATWEGFQNWIGYNLGHFRNMVGDVDRVDYFGGATFITNENASRQNGVSLGGFININIRGEIPSNVSFEQFVLSTPLYMHEYGHTFQSERSGFGYLIGYGIPSLLSAEKDGKRGHVHDDFGTETSANRWARKYFDKHYKGLVDWSQYLNPDGVYYPLN